MPLSLLLAILLALSACASGHKRLPRGAKPPPVVEREIGPERGASDSLVESGRVYLEQQLYDRASDAFQQAANVDPTNGSAFYYLALVKFRTGEYEAVWDFLEKAEGLLAGDKHWAEQLEELRRDVNEVKPHP